MTEQLPLPLSHLYFFFRLFLTLLISNPSSSVTPSSDFPERFSSSLSFDPRQRLNASTTVHILGHRITILLKESESEVTQSCPTLCNSMDCSLPGFSIHGIFQARVLEWVAISFSRWSSWPRDRTWVSDTAGGCFTLWATSWCKSNCNFALLKFAIWCWNIFLNKCGYVICHFDAHFSLYILLLMT